MWPSPRCQKTRLPALLWESPLHELILGLLSIAEKARRIQNIPQSSCLAFAFRKDATAVPQLCQCVCRLLNICIKINMTAHTKPAIFPFTWGIIPEPRQILSFVHWPRGVNYVCCEKTRRVPQVHGTVVLARWSMAGMLISRGVLQTPNCNWSLLLYH